MKNIRSTKVQGKLLTSFFLLLFIGFLASAQEEIVISTYPDKVHALKTEYEQLIHVDFYLENKTQGIMNIDELRIRAYDKDHKIMLSKYLGNQGVSPGILTIPARTIPAGKKIVVFNPFYSFSKDAPIDHLEFNFILSNVFSKKVMKTVTVTLTDYKQTVTHSLPLKGRVLAIDGNDYYSHHRRFDFTHISASLMKMTEQAGRYGYDFGIVNQDGLEFENEGKKLSEWYCFGQNVYATASGVVADMNDGALDGNIGTITFSYNDVPNNPKLMGGNYVVVKHADGNFSSYIHMKKGSVKVAKGDKVKKGQVVGQVGNSGDSYSPHLHYHLSSTANLFNSKGVPVYFSNYQKVMGGSMLKVKSNGYINTGEIVENK